MERSKSIIVTTDASGAAQAARDRMLVMIVDVIDMSTTLESAVDAGAYAVLGCSPDMSRAPVMLSPEKIGAEAARLARAKGTGIIIVSEPRVGSDEERKSRCQRFIKAVASAHGTIEGIVPNLGAETPKLIDMKNKVIVAVTDTGGVAFDAAFNVRERVLTGTVARTFGQKGLQPALTAVRRACSLLEPEDRGIAVVAASRNSMEDILAAQFIANLLLKEIPG